MKTGYSMTFEMCKHPWRGGVIIFDDATAKMYSSRLSPNYPVLVQVEGESPTEEQIEACRALWQRLYQDMDFRLATFCPTLLPHCRKILGGQDAMSAVS